MMGSVSGVAEGSVGTTGMVDNILLEMFGGAEKSLSGDRGRESQPGAK
jgi:hypothetical protein